MNACPTHPNAEYCCEGLYMTIPVDVDQLESEEGTVCVFSGHTVDEHWPVVFAADWRPALEIASALIEARLAGGQPKVRVELEPWQILGGAW